MNKASPLTCIIPTFNGNHLLKKHLPSLLEAMIDGDCLIISDDASTDDTVASLSEQFNLKLIDPDNEASQSSVYQGYTGLRSKHIKVILLVHKENVRFAESVNRAVAVCSTPYFFLVNNDVSVTSDCLSILRNQIQADKTIFAVSCLEYEDSKSGEKSGKNKLWFEKGLFRHSKAEDFSSGPTAWASGGSSIFDTQKWKDLGGFDTNFYPAYWEDTDISYRARKKGWQVLFNEKAVVYHKHESTNLTEFGRKSLENISWKNAFYFTWKHANLRQRFEFCIWYSYWQWKRAKKILPKRMT